VNAEKTVARYRVRKEDAAPSQIVKQDGLAICLECWKMWMASDDKDLGASRMKFDSYRDDDDKEQDRAGYESDPYEEQRRADMKIGQATGAMIEDLKPAHRWALYRKCGVTTVWNFPSVDFLSCLAAAQAELERKLRVHIATATQFL